MLLAALTPHLLGCTTVPISVKPELDVSLTEPCPALPSAEIKVGDDIRPATLKHLALVAKLYSDCAASKEALLGAVR